MNGAPVGTKSEKLYAKLIDLKKLPMIDLTKISNPVLNRAVNKQASTRQAQLKFLICASQKDHSEELKNKYRAAMGNVMPSKSEFYYFLEHIENVIKEGETTSKGLCNI
jgi:hypothetical protein